MQIIWEERDIHPGLKMEDPTTLYVVYQDVHNGKWLLVNNRNHCMQVHGSKADIVEYAKMYKLTPLIRE